MLNIKEFSANSSTSEDSAYGDPTKAPSDSCSKLTTSSTCFSSELLCFSPTRDCLTLARKISLTKAPSVPPSEIQTSSMCRSSELFHTSPTQSQSLFTLARKSHSMADHKGSPTKDIASMGMSLGHAVDSVSSDISNNEEIEHGNPSVPLCGLWKHIRRITPVSIWLGSLETRWSFFNSFSMNLMKLHTVTFTHF